MGNEVTIQVAPAVQRRGPNIGPLGVPAFMGEQSKRKKSRNKIRKSELIRR